jgi:hypothetical protein
MARSDVSNGALELVHHHPGRLRVRAEVFRTLLGPWVQDASAQSGRRLELVEEVRRFVVGLAGITGFTHSPRTGSILVEYEPGLTEPDDVVEEIARVARLERPTEDAVRAQRRPPAVLAVGAVRELNELTKELTGSRLDLRLLVPTALAAASAYSLVYSKEPRLPRWDNLLYWSYNVFVSLHRQEIEGPVRRPSSLRSVSAPSRGPGDGGERPT